MHFHNQPASSITSSICLALILLGLCEASNIWDGDLEAPADWLKINYRKQFVQINQILIERLPENEDLKANMKKANEYLSSLLSCDRLSASDSKMSKALYLFVSLNEIDGKDKCNMESYRILLQNDISSGNVAHQSIPESRLESLSRVQRFVHDQSIRHAESCYSLYPEIFKTIYRNMDRQMVESVERLLDDYIHSQIGPGRGSYSEKIYNRFVFQPEAMGVWNFAKAFYESTDDIAKLLSPSKNFLSRLREREVGRTKVMHIYKKRVIEPCDYYVRRLGRVFLPARYDAVFHKEDDDDEYYTSWARFRLCSGILAIKFDALFKNIQKIHSVTSAREKEAHSKGDKQVDD